MIIARAPAEQAWTPVMTAEVLFKPIDRMMLRRARRAAVKALGEAVPADSDAALSDQLEELGDALSHALLMEGILDWRGVAVEVVEGGRSGTSELPCTPENRALVLSDAIIFDAFDQAYVVPYIARERERAAPGNAYAASPNGTGEAVTPDSATANNPANPTNEAAVKPARTSPKKRNPRRKKASGAS